MQDLPNAIDIEALLRLARKKYDIGPLASNIKRMRELWSIRRDIDAALAALVVLAKLREGIRHVRQSTDQPDYEQSLVVRSLFVDALLGYCRATMGSGPRDHISIDGFSVSEREAHGRCEVIRNQVFAHHVHKDTKDSDGGWLAEKLVVVNNDGYSTLRFAAVNKVVSPTMVAELDGLLRAIGRFAESEGMELEVATYPLLDQFLTNESVRALCIKAEFQPQTFYPLTQDVSSLDSLERMLGQPGYAHPKPGEYKLQNG